jgi:quercetin dioxygenase-like cupin family protein
MADPASAFGDLGSIAPQLLADGYLARAVHGEQLTLAVVEIEPGAVLPEHAHANEQFGLVLEGSVLFRIGDEEQTLERGGIWRIPSDTPHAVTGGGSGAVVIDVFAPPRDDWRERETSPLRPAIWP